jgi:hypothetical protein
VETVTVVVDAEATDGIAMLNPRMKAAATPTEMIFRTIPPFVRLLYAA